MVERAAEAFLSETERAAGADPGFGIAESRTRIDRDGLKIVYFVQDTGSRRILNAVLAEVEAP